MFKAAIRTIVDPTPRCMGGIIMGFDGIRVDHYMAEDADGSPEVRDVGAELSVILMAVRNAAEMLDIGGASELVVKAERFDILARIVDAEYFIAIVLHPDAVTGQARFLTRRAAVEVKKLLE